MRHWGTTETLSPRDKVSDFDLPALVALHKAEAAGYRSLSHPLLSYRLSVWAA